MKHLNTVEPHWSAVMTLAGAFILFAIMAPLYRHRICTSIRHGPTIKAYFAAALPMVVSGTIYLLMGNGTTYAFAKYAFDRIEYLEDDPLNGRLPDLILDLFDVKEDTMVVAVADAVAFFLPCVCFILCFTLNHPDIVNAGLWQNTILLVANGIAENVTMVPSALGWDRCKSRSFREVNSIADQKFGLAGIGGCASMIWSGHISHTVLTAYWSVHVLEREYEAVARITKREFIGITMKMRIVWIIGFIEAILILATHDHYSVDIWISFVITSQLLSNDKFVYWAGRLNPYLKQLNTPTTFYGQALRNAEAMEKLERTNPSVYFALVGDTSRESIDDSPIHPASSPRLNPELSENQYGMSTRSKDAIIPVSVEIAEAPGLPVQKNRVEPTATPPTTTM